MDTLALAIFNSALSFVAILWVTRDYRMNQSQEAVFAKRYGHR